MADITPIVSLNGEISPTASLTGELAMPEKVWMQGPPGPQGPKGDKGTDGREITSVAKISTSGLVDTYKISFSDNTSTNFTVTNGSSIKSIAKTGTSGLTDTYTVTLTDGTTSTFTVKNGNGIASITLQSGTHAAGTTDTYKITFDNGEFTTFSVYNGMNGSGSVVTVNGIAPDTDGNVVLTGSVIPVSPTDSTLIPAAIEKRQIATNDLTAEATLADGDYFPFYDVSSSSSKKTPWSNIISKIRAAFASTPLAIEAGGTNAKTAAEARENLGALSSADGSITTPKYADGSITAQKLAEKAVTREKMAIDAFTPADNAGAHNAVYRGKNLGSAVTAAQWAAIDAGTFEDLFIGDYWTINGVNWRIAAFDYYLASDMPDHHVVIVPDAALYTAVMNDTSATTGGYAGSKMRTTNLEQAKTTINNAFGSDHILTFAESLVNAVSSGLPSGISTYECTVELMTERQVYGSSIFGGCPWGSSTVPTLNTKDRTQFPLFALNPYLASLSWYWLRDIVSDSNFAGSNGATAGYAYAGYAAGGVRPYFCIKA